MGEAIIYVATCILYYDTAPFVCLLDGEVLVSAKGLEVLEFLFREVGVCGWQWDGGEGRHGESDVLL